MKKLNIGVLRHEFRSYHTSEILKKASAKGNVIKLDPKHICLFLRKGMDVTLRQKNVTDLDILIPRVDSDYFDFGLWVVKQYEKLGVPCVNSSKTIEICQNKFLTSLALKKKKVPEPDCAIAASPTDMIKHIKKMQKPLVVKLLYGSLGLGTAKINDDQEAQDWLETLGELKQPVYIQEYVEKQNTDYRLFIVGDKVITGIKRVAKPGQWKTNLQYIENRESFKPSKELKEFGFKCMDAVKADVCAIDFAIVNDRPMVFEINQCPYFHALKHKRTSLDFGKAIVDFAVKKAKR